MYETARSGDRRMTDREKIIDEIKNYMRENAEMGWVNEDEVLQKIKELIPEGAVVLTKDELADTQARMAYLQEELGKLLRGDNISVSEKEYGQLLYANENASKETAREILSDISKTTTFRYARYTAT